MHLKTLVTSTFACLGMLSVAFTVTGYAQTNPTNPGGGSVTTPMAQATAIPAASPTYKLDMTACLATFDWIQYVADVRAGLNNSNPYVNPRYAATPLNQRPTSAGDYDAACAREAGMPKANVTKYSDMTVGTAEVLASMDQHGNFPIVGIYPNGTYPAQAVGGGTPVDRSRLENIDNIFTAEQLAQMYSTYTAAQRSSIGAAGNPITGVPRVYSTGPDTYVTNAQGQRVYQGGWCMVENGQLKVRTTRAGQPFDPAPFGRSVSTPETSCARTVNGQRLPAVENRELRAYQFVYTLRYPTATECQSWFNVDATTCNTFFQNRYGRDLAGNTSTTQGRAIVSTYTFYGSFDDRYTRWVGWRNPDSASPGPRAASTDAFVRGYDGYSVYELN